MNRKLIKNNALAQRGAAVKSILLFLSSLVLIALIATGVAGYFAWAEIKKPGPSDELTVVMLEPGSSVAKIADTLEGAGVIQNVELFTAAVRVKGVQSELKAGEFEIPARASVTEIIDLLIDGKSILHAITIPEGLTTAQILRLVEGHEILEGDVVVELEEGSLLPETYSFTRGETREAMVRRMMTAQKNLVEKLWADRAMELPISSTQEAIILASIVEKETGQADERPMIASVFVNRLKRGMRLQSDPTIIYGLTQGEPLGRGLRQSEIRGATPYNTYVIDRLPPTPIANPGADAIAAVLKPAESEYLFFVADGSGGHVFAKTNREHQRNVAQWRRIERELRQRGN